MDRDEMLKILLQLAEGVNPDTGEVYEDESPYQSPRVVRALFQAVRELEAHQVLPRKPAPFEVPLLDETGQAILEQLRKWRTERAKAASLPAYIILSDKALSHIAFLKPASPERLLEAHGVGPSKVEQFGAEIVSIVQSLTPTVAPEPSPARHELNTAAGLPARAYAAWSDPEDEDLRRLYAAGLTIRQLAQHFGRKPGAIESRLAKLSLREGRLG